MTIVFGALSPALAEQLKGLLPHRELKVFDEAAHAIVLLHIAGILNDSATHVARKKLLRKIEKRQAARRP